MVLPRTVSVVAIVERSGMGSVFAIEAAGDARVAGEVHYGCRGVASAAWLP